jgi:hypothetical protein
MQQLVGIDLDLIHQQVLVNALFKAEVTVIRRETTVPNTDVEA